ncbi:DUF6470 family protein [Calditerricola satsumensis]|uniref:Uncharacterized protein n=3 Tax=Calditerricola satsumensis TaxID=373054 RepID=A0A8J3B587_9BACI|nr:DUF6470 family protein [Calditerricola satsumensis]GGJ94547.1 hypothetical protein GCM10007043_05370 [Calditerricola satsumensis]
MQLPRLEIRQTFARLGLEITRPVQEIEQPKPDLGLTQRPARLTIERVPGRLVIDQSEAWAASGLKDPLTLARDCAAEGREAALDGIARIAEEGDRLRAIETGENAIAAIAAEKALPPPADFTIALMPSPFSVKMRYEPTRLLLHWELGGAFFDPKTHRPVHRYIPGKVNPYLLQKQQLEIAVVMPQVDRRA